MTLNHRFDFPLSCMYPSGPTLANVSMVEPERYVIPCLDSRLNNWKYVDDTICFGKTD